ncbi:transporter [Hymenobacter terricola]|uniref:transporter n=1 Tax=Hymenobacter terricola TaxID=2819236 RepID=UPI001B3158DB|nr:transporter [Hymenobacter terricola]
MQDTNVQVTTLTVNEVVKDDDPQYNAPAIAEQFWHLFNQTPGHFEAEGIYCLLLRNVRLARVCDARQHLVGTAIQWFDCHFLGTRLELDVSLPIGAFQRAYIITPSTHFFTITPCYAFTLSPSDKFSISMRHHLNYNFNVIGTHTRPGISYNTNYAFEYAVLPGLRAEIAGYFLTQLNQDSAGGDGRYFLTRYQLADTRERAMAIGPGQGYVSPSGRWWLSTAGR